MIIVLSIIQSLADYTNRFRNFENVWFCSRDIIVLNVTSSILFILHNQTYFDKYGYLSPDEIQPGKTPNETLGSDEFRRAVKTLQTYANIEVTGVVDEETQAVMTQPRCGNDDPRLPDAEIDITTTTSPGNVGADVTSPSVRVRRYNVAGGNYKWNRDTLYYWIKTFPGPKSNLSEYIVRYDVRQAFKLWSDVTPLV